MIVLQLKYKKKKGGKRFFGTDLKIIQRGVTHIVGQMQNDKNNDFQIYDGLQSWGTLLKIPSKKSSGARPGDLVLVKIIKYPSEKSDFIGQVVEIIGDSQDPKTDIKRVLYNHQVPMKFPPEVLNEANRISQKVSPKEYKQRRNLRKLPFITHRWCDSQRL